MELKIAILIIVVSVSNLAAVTTYSQSAKVSLDINNKSVEQVLDEIESQSEFYFIFNQKQIDVNKVVDIHAEDKLISDILPELFKGTNVNYLVLDRKILLTTDSINTTDLVSLTGSQQLTVTGKITDAETGEPMIGVNISVKGTSIGTISGIDGSYSLSVSDRDAILVFSFIGYVGQEVPLSGRTTVNVVLIGEITGLDEVVVIGYGTQKRVTLTGAATSVKAVDLIALPNASLAQTLEGRAAGIRIQQGSSITGASANIRFRGSIEDPLYVVDDIVVEKAAFDDLTAEEIESINFMKDAATASIYGARASNGVVVVRTKRGGFNQKAIFNYQGSYYRQYLPLSAEDFDFTFDKVLYAIEMKSTGGFTDPGLTPEEKTWLAANPDFNGFGNAREWLWQSPYGQQHNLSATGGTESVSYFVGLGYQNDNPGMKSGNFGKYNYRASITAKVTPTIKIEWISDGYIKESDRPYFRWQGGDGLSESENGWYQHLDYPADVVYATVVDKNAGTGRIAQPEDYGKPGFGFASYRFTAIDGSDGGYKSNTWRNFNNKLRLTWDMSSITKGLSSSVLGSYSNATRFYKEFTQWYDFYYPTLVSSSNRWLYSTDLSTWQQQKMAINQSLPSMVQRQWNTNSYQYNIFLNYDRSFGSHNISGVMLYEAAGNYNWYNSGSKRDIIGADVDQLYNFSGTAENTSYTGSESHYARASFAGRIGYNYKEKYMLQASWRNDASSLFPSDTRWGFFPSFSAAWRIDEEDFFNIGWINELKPRFSYGTSGSEGGIAPFQYQASYQTTTGWQYQGAFSPGLRSGVLPNPDITWAKTTGYNLGLDFALFKNLVSGGIDLFLRKNSDILGTRSQQFPSTWGASLPAVNYAANEIRGFDLFLAYNNQSGQFSYSVRGNVGYAIDKVTVMDENPEIQGTWRSNIGEPANRLWGYHSLGVIKDQATLDALPAGFTQWGRTPVLGELLIKDIRGTNYSEGPDGKVDSYDYDILSKNGAPRIVYGFNLQGSWKGISLDAQFSGVGAFDKYYAQAWGPGSITRNAQVLMERWHPVLNPDGWLPTYFDNYWAMPERGHGPTSTFMFNASYLRLKNLTLSYALPKKLMDPVGLSGLSVFVAATDVFVLTKWFFQDPETQDASSYPRLKTYSGGININF